MKMALLDTRLTDEDRNIKKPCFVQVQATHMLMPLVNGGKQGQKEAWEKARRKGHGSKAHCHHHTF